MEQRKDVHYEIQWENCRGEWAELLQERPRNEEEVTELCGRARVAHPGENIRAVKVTTLVTVEDIRDDSGPEGELQACREPVFELLQDCD